LTTYLTGAQHTLAINQLQRKIEIPPEIYYLEEDVTPLVILSWGGRGADGLPIKRDRVGNPEFKVLEKEPHENWTAINNGAGYTAGDVTFTVDSASMLVAGILLQVVTSGEILHVSVVNGATQITVDRSIGVTVAGVLADNTPLEIIGNVNAENSGVPPYKRVKVRDRGNYCQIFKEPVGLSGTLKRSDSVGPDFMSDLHKEAWLEWRKRIERAFLWGEPFEDTTVIDANGYPARGTGGVYYWIATVTGNVTSVATTLTKAIWRTFSRNLFKRGGKRKVVLCSPLVIEALDAWKEGKLQMRPSDEVYGIRVAEWETGQGTMLIARDAELEDSPYGTGGHGGMAIGLEPKNLSYKHLGKDGAEHLQENVQERGVDGEIDQIFGEIGLGIKLPETGHILENIEEYSES
jgi:hypothetical protein